MGLQVSIWWKQLTTKIQGKAGCEGIQSRKKGIFFFYPLTLKAKPWSCFPEFTIRSVPNLIRIKNWTIGGRAPSGSLILISSRIRGLAPLVLEISTWWLNYNLLFSTRKGTTNTSAPKMVTSLCPSSSVWFIMWTISPHSIFCLEMHAFMEGLFPSLVHYRFNPHSLPYAVLYLSMG